MWLERGNFLVTLVSLAALFSQHAYTEAQTSGFNFQLTECSQMTTEETCTSLEQSIPLCVVKKSRPAFQKIEECTTECSPEGFATYKVSYELTEDIETTEFIGFCRFDGETCGCDVAFPDALATFEAGMPEGGCTDTPCTSAGGDPHFSLWHGGQRVYHGGCDLVLIHNPNFGGHGIVLDLHVRTEVRDNYSSISNAAVRIGANTLEVAKEKVFHVNGKAMQRDELPGWLGSYKLEHMDGSRCFVHCHDYVGIRVNLGGETFIELTVWKDLVFVNASGDNEKLAGSVGLLGTFGHPGLIARDGVARFNNFVEYSEHWQVQGDEPKLFQTPRSPQHPEPCIPPPPRRLGEIPHGRRLAAEEACAKTKGVEREFCLHDVMLTGDTELAQAPFYNGRYGNSFR